jgi:hypothetical protein
MKKIKNIMLLSLLAVVVVTSSCSDFLNVNTDPNRVTGDNITPDLIFTQAENAVGRQQALRYIFLNKWMGYWASSGTFIVEQEETSYQIANTFTENNWDNIYNTLFDLDQVRTKAVAKNDQVLAGAAMVLSAKLWQETVDQFGAIPYSKAFNVGKYSQPAYDKAPAIYADLLVKLDTAITKLKSGKTTANFVKADIIFGRGGDLTTAVNKWVKFANTIKLRMFLRQSAIGVAPTPAQIAKMTADGGFLGTGEDVSVQPGYSNDNLKQNPFYGAFGLTPSGAAATTVHTANAYFVKTIEQYGTASVDPRVTQFFAAPITPTYYGALNGNIVPGGPQIVGTGMGPGVLKSATADQFILPAFESLFFQAEAVTRGWIPGTAQTVYESAVKESFNWLGVTDANNAATTYLSTNSKAMWSGATTTEAKINLVAFQKYIALCGIDPVESWSDLRRGVLVLPAGYLSNNPNAAGYAVPNVLTYPQTEFTTNAVNVPTPVRTTATIFKEKLFWQP